MSNTMNMNPESCAESEPEIEWDEVYNSTDERQGEPREYMNQSGTFYQTYGNGGGENGWGGYWVREGRVWKVAGQEFKYLENHVLEYEPQKSMEGKVAQCRVFVPNPTCVFCKKPCDCKYGHNPRPLKSEGVCCNACNHMVILARVGMLKLNAEGEFEFQNLNYKPTMIGLNKGTD